MSARRSVACRCASRSRARWTGPRGTSRRSRAGRSSRAARSRARARRVPTRRRFLARRPTRARGRCARGGSSRMTTPPPTPVPMITPNATRAPRAAPHTASASAKQFASFAKATSPRPSALARSARNGRPFRHVVFEFFTSGDVRARPVGVVASSPSPACRRRSRARCSSTSSMPASRATSATSARVCSTMCS